MTRKQLTVSSFPKMIEAFSRQNFNLKALCAGLIGLCFLLLVLVLFLVKRGPLVVALESGGEIARIETKITDLQIQSAVREYLAMRYTWTDKDFEDRLKRAEFFVYPSLVPAFRRAMAETQKFVVEKKVSQRVYPRTISVDLKAKTVAVKADRVTEFDGLKAATELSLIFQFALDDRTPANPWGVYIAKETEREVSK